MYTKSRQLVTVQSKACGKRLQSEVRVRLRWNFLSHGAARVTEKSHCNSNKAQAATSLHRYAYSFTEWYITRRGVHGTTCRTCERRRRALSVSIKEKHLRLETCLKMLEFCIRFTSSINGFHSAGLHTDGEKRGYPQAEVSPTKMTHQ